MARNKQAAQRDRMNKRIEVEHVLPNENKRLKDLDAELDEQIS